MARLTANKALCQGYGNCISSAPDVYDIDDDGKVALLSVEIEESDRIRIEGAVRSCPVQALAIED